MPFQTSVLGGTWTFLSSSASVGQLVEQWSVISLPVWRQSNELCLSSKATVLMRLECLLIIRLPGIKPITLVLPVFEMFNIVGAFLLGTHLCSRSRPSNMFPLASFNVPLIQCAFQADHDAQVN